MIARTYKFAITLAILLFATHSFAQNSRIPQWIQQEKFLRACEYADLDAIKMNLKNGISPNTRDKFGQSALLRAIMGFNVFRKTPDAVKLLLEAGADINVTNEFGSTAVFWTVDEPDVPRNPHQLLLKAGIDQSKKDKYGSTFNERKYFDARAEQTDELAWRFLIEGRINWSAEWETIRAMPRHGNSASAMMAAAYYGIVLGKATGRMGSDWQVEVDNNKENYLFYLATRPKIYSDELFSIHSSAVNMPNVNGETPLIRAARFDNSMLARKLLLLGADADRRDDQGKLALEYSVEYDYFDSTLLLLTRTNHRLTNKTGRSPLMMAVEHGNMNALRAFSVAVQFARAAPAEARKKEGSERTELLQLAAKYRTINVDHQDQEGMTALMIAVDAENLEAVKTIILFRANKLLKNKKGKTALDLARSKGNTEIVKLLSSRR